MNTVYAFGTFNVIVSHPSKGQLVLNGEGIKSASFVGANDVSAQDVASDGSVMTSKIEAYNGTATFVLQQTSDAHRWLTDLFNYLVTADPSEWNQISVNGHSEAMQVTNSATGCSFQKRSDKAYGSTGADVTWALLAEKLTEENG